MLDARSAVHEAMMEIEPFSSRAEYEMKGLFSRIDAIVWALTQARDTLDGALR